MTENTTASGAAYALLHILDAIKTGRFVPVGPESLGYCKAAVQAAERALAASAPVAPTPPVSITLDFKQATELLGMYGGEPTEVTLMVGNGHSGKGVYAHWTSVPEEEAMFLGASNDEAAPVAPAPQPAVLTADQKEYLDQAQTMLEDYAEILDRAGSNSAAKGAEASAHVIRGMLEAAPQAPLQPITEAEQAAWHAGPDEGRSQARVPLQQGEYLPMTSAPKDGSLIRMLVKFEDHPLDDDDQPQWTVGFNNLSNTQVDEWQFVGWSWQSDLFCDGTGTPIGWLPMLDASRRAAQAAPAPVAEDAEDAANWKWLAAYLVGPRTDRDDEIVASESVNDLRKLVSAARARAQAAQPEGGA